MTYVCLNSTRTSSLITSERQPPVTARPEEHPIKPLTSSMRLRLLQLIMNQCGCNYMKCYPMRPNALRCHRT